MYVLSDDNIINHKFDQSIVIIGNFDGIHLGHRKLLDQAKIIADEKKLPILMMCFDPHPAKFFRKTEEFGYILPLIDKIRILKKYSINYLFIKQFDEYFANISAEEFIKKYLVNLLRTKYIIIGKNFFFGKNAEGDFKTLKKFSIEYNYKILTEEILSIKLDQNTISSSNIRNFLKLGQIYKATEMLGEKYKITLEISKRDFKKLSVFVQNDLALKSGNYLVYLDNIDEKIFLNFFYSNIGKSSLDWHNKLEGQKQISVIIERFLY